MDLRLSAEQSQLVDAVSALLTKHSSPERVREAEPLGFDEDLWSRLLEMGVVAMVVGEAAGGWGASLLDVELVAEQVGRFVAPAPVIEAQVAARLLERLGHDVASATLESVLTGGRLVTMALHPAIEGEARLVPAAAVAGAAVVPSEDSLRLVELDPPPAHVENLGSMPLADVAVPRHAAVLAAGAEAQAAFDRAIDEWLVLTAGALVGIGQKSLAIGVEYARERRAFGVPIGSFQAIAHRLADSAAAVDAALLVAREAACAADADDPRFGELAAMAFGLAYEAARDASYRSLHFPRRLRLHDGVRHPAALPPGSSLGERAGRAVGDPPACRRQALRPGRRRVVGLSG